ncbi:MAG: DUF2085 domain-containing protein [Oscillochloris sp.]|nr:DUF2085 domain-containing protein [Oscillochloris sp.]
MSEKSPEEVIRLAQQQIAERHAHQAQAQATQLDDRLRRELPWRRIFAGIGTLLLLALIFSPGAPLQWKMYAVVHGVCAQQHNIFLGGLQFPLCARNSGVYMSFLLTLGYIYAIGRARAARIPPWPITLLLILFVVIMGVDGFNSLFVDLGLRSLYQPDNFLRTLTGMGMGIAIAVMLHIVLNMTLRKNVEDTQPVLRNWWELLGIMAIDLLALAAIYANLGFMFWPLAFVAFFGINGVLYMVALLLTSLLLGYEGKITSIRQLALPATLAIIPTLIILAAMSYLRFWMERIGLII